MHSLETIMSTNAKAYNRFMTMREQAKKQAKIKPYVIPFIGKAAKAFKAGLRYKSGKDMAKAFGVMA